MCDRIGINHPNESTLMENDVGVSVISQERRNLLNSPFDVSFVEDSYLSVKFPPGKTKLISLLNLSMYTILRQKEFS